MKSRLLVLFLLLSSVCFAQRFKDQDGPYTLTTGQTHTFTDNLGTAANKFEYIISGSPSGVSITVKCVMPGGTESAAEDTFTATSSGISGVVYDTCAKYKVAVTFTGGTSPTLVVYRYGTVGGTKP